MGLCEANSWRANNCLNSFIMDTCCDSKMGFQFSCSLSDSPEKSIPNGCRPSDRCTINAMPIIDTAPAALKNNTTSLPDDYFDGVLSYLNHMLMEEDLEQRAYMYKDSNALHAAEKSFYDALKGKDPLISPTQLSVEVSDQEIRSTCLPKESSKFASWNLDQVKFVPFQLQSSLISHQVTPANLSSSAPSISFSNDLFRMSTAQSIKESPGNEESGSFRVGAIEEHNERGYVPRDGGKKATRCRVDDDDDNDDGHEGQRDAKRNASFVDENIDDLADKYDNLLLCPSRNPNFYVKSSSCGIDQTEGRYSPPIILPHEPKRGRPRASERKLNMKLVDLNSLLSQCADFVISCDNMIANQLLNQIRQHSSSYGNADERLAYWFANALEARISGTGTILYSAFYSKRVSTAETLKAKQAYFISCPFQRMSNIFAGKTIGRLTSEATNIHIIDFGIDLGFQWPCFIHGISLRPEGPPKLRVTGIDLPQPGFRPAERVEETGRRLSHYCQKFNIAFEYHAIAKKWDTISLDDLKIDRNETIVVNCMYKLRHVSDDATGDCSQRDKVLNLIHHIKPDIFIHGILNGSYNAPFFVTRFREAIFQFSSLFDMFEKTLPSDDKERLVLEKELGRESMNVIACEGSERIERPESYRKWQARNQRAGFRQLPLLPEVVEEVRAKVKLRYHKDFLVDEDNNWMLQGWKGRVTYAISCWTPMFE